jgi:hypothetical protein
MFRRRHAGTDELRVFFATDIHGSNACFKKFVNAAKFYDASVLILGGDVTGKMVVPIARQADGTHLAEFAGREERLDGDEAVARFERLVADMGFYPVVMDEEEFQAVRGDPGRQDALFKERIERRLREWVEWAAPRIRDQHLRCYAAPGNDDGFYVDDLLGDSGVIELLEMRVAEIEGIPILTTGWSNETPWKTERECTEDELRSRLQSLIAQLDDPRRAIFNVHVPPYATALDQCPELDAELRPVHHGGNPVMTSAGSTAVRELIEQHQPMLGLHGHIHEGRGVAHLGQTICVNPGSNYSEGVLNGSLIRFEGGRVKDVQLTSG